MKIKKEPITGHYGQFNIDGLMHRIYWEEAGKGIPLVCLHTAGSDGRQYRALLNDKKILENFRVIVFDMPWHGKSSPPNGSKIGSYKLSTESYIYQIMSFIDGLELVKPWAGNIPSRITTRIKTGLSSFWVPTPDFCNFYAALFEV